MSNKVPQQYNPLERGVRKMEVLMRTFGMRTRMFKGSSRAVVKGTRKVYPYEVKATIVETARGVGIRITSEKLWYSFLKLIPFLMLTIISILQLVSPNLGEKMAEGIGINLFLLVLGPSPKPFCILIVLPIFAALIIGMEILERIIRVKYIQDRMPRFLSGAEWTVAEPPVIMDIFASSYNLFWLMWIILLLIFAPISFSSEIYNKFLTVYKTESANLQQSTLLMSILDVGIISGMLFAILYANYERFREEIDSKQTAQRIRFENESRQMIQVAIGSVVLATFEHSIFYFMFWSNISILLTIIFYAITILSSTLAIWLFWQKESYNFIAIEIWLFLSLVVMVFLNANNPGFSWMIICHLFLIFLTLGLFLNLYLREYLEKKGIFEPSWMFNPLPLITLIEVLKKKKAKVSRGAERELEEIRAEELVEKAKEREPLVISLKKIRNKGKEAEKIIQVYQKIINRIARKEVSLLTFTAINHEILKILEEKPELKTKAEQIFDTIDRLLWDETYKLKDGKETLSIAEEVYNEVLKAR
ncbi:MAG: hypothetical protein ACTSPI_03445 [Candidatus Heimdallarchaeaceae archaeon]